MAAVANVNYISPLQISFVRAQADSIQRNIRRLIRNKLCYYLPKINPSSLRRVPENSSCYRRRGGDTLPRVLSRYIRHNSRTWQKYATAALTSSSYVLLELNARVRDDTLFNV